MINCMLPFKPQEFLCPRKTCEAWESLVFIQIFSSQLVLLLRLVMFFCLMLMLISGFGGFFLVTFFIVTQTNWVTQQERQCNNRLSPRAGVKTGWNLKHGYKLFESAPEYVSDVFCSERESACQSQSREASGFRLILFSPARRLMPLHLVSFRSDQTESSSELEKQTVMWVSPIWMKWHSDFGVGWWRCNAGVCDSVVCVWVSASS